jgi:hypothetical protein
MFLLKTDAALLMMQAKGAQWVMKADGYLWQEAWAGVRDCAVWDLVQEETGVCLRGVADGKILSAVVGERVRCAMEVGAFTLRDAARVNLTVGCAMGDAPLGDVGCTLGAT